MEIKRENRHTGLELRLNKPGGENPQIMGDPMDPTGHMTPWHPSIRAAAGALVPRLHGGHIYTGNHRTSVSPVWEATESVATRHG